MELHLCLLSLNRYLNNINTRACQVLYLSMHAGFAFARLLLLHRTTAHHAAGDEGVSVGDAGPSFVEALFNPFWVMLACDWQQYYANQTV